MDVIAAPIARMLDSDVEELRLVISLLMSYPLALIYRRITDAGMKHIYSAVVGLYFVYYCYGPDAIHPVAASFGTYFLTKYLPKKHAAKIVFVWAMGYLSAVNISTMIGRDFGYKVDITGLQMMLTVKLISFAYDYSTPVQESPQSPSSSPREVKQEDHRKPTAVPPIPPLTTFLGYAFFFCTFLTGPPFEIRDYLGAVEGTAFQDSYCKGQNPKEAIGRGFKRMIFGLCFIPLILVGKQWPGTILLEEPYISTNYVHRFLVMWFLIFLFRAKYYFVWNVAEGSATICGLGYNGYDEEKKTPKWDKINNVEFIGLEFAQNITMVNAAWNKGTTRWLKKYIYNGLAATPGKPPGIYNTMMTYLTSSLWHGFYPGYYMFFVTYGTLVTELSKDIRRHVRPLFLSSPTKKLIWDILGTMATIWILHYGAIAFVVLDFWTTVRIWSSFYWSCHIVAVLGLVYFRLIHKRIFRVKKHPQ